MCRRLDRLCYLLRRGLGRFARDRFAGSAARVLAGHGSRLADMDLFSGTAQSTNWSTALGHGAFAAARSDSLRPLQHRLVAWRQWIAD